MLLSCLVFKQMNICDALRDLVPLAQFRKRENIHWDVLLLLKLQVSFKLYKWYQIVQSISYSWSWNIFSENDRKTSVNALWTTKQFFPVKHFILKFESLTKRYGNLESTIKFTAVFYSIIVRKYTAHVKINGSFSKIKVEKYSIMDVNRK